MLFSTKQLEIFRSASPQKLEKVKQDSANLFEFADFIGESDSGRNKQKIPSHTSRNLKIQNFSRIENNLHTDDDNSVAMVAPKDKSESKLSFVIICDELAPDKSIITASPNNPFTPSKHYFKSITRTKYNINSDYYKSKYLFITKI